MRVGDRAMPISAKHRCCARLVAVALVALAAPAAWAQAVPPAIGVGPAQAAPVEPATPAPQQQSAPAGFPAQPPGAEKSGFIAELGRWWDDTRHKLGTLPPPPGLPPPPPLPPPPDDAAKNAAAATQDAMRNAAEATKDAVNAIARIPATRMVEVRALCPLAPNGAPDCRQAAANACRGKGFSSGDPIDVRSSENCPPAIVLSGRQPSAGECPTETVVLAAACH
jgi:hypothetical protein